MPTELTPTEFQNAIRRLLVLTCAADEQIDPAEVRMLAKVHQALTGAELSESDLLDELDELHRKPVDLSSFVRELAPSLSWEHKQQFLKAAILVATADGTVQAEEDALVEQVASSLASAPAELQRLIQAVRFVRPKEV